MTPPPLTIRLFGTLRVAVRGAPLPPVRTRSVEWLLALLALRHGEAVNRAWLAGTLWPESQKRRAFQNLRNDLLLLRKALGPESGRLQSPTVDALALDLEDAEVDVLQFDAAIRAGDEASLRRAVELSTAPLLENCLEEWAFAERQTRAEQLLGALEALAAGAEGRGDHDEAIRYLVRAQALDPLRDSSARRLMANLAAAGDPAAAIQIYRDFRVRLQEELAVSPDEATTRLFQEIRATARHPAGTGRRGDGETGRADKVKIAPFPCPPVSPAPLPRPLTALIGREQELAEVQAALQSRRLVTLIGGGGVGKTRLAIQAATEIAGDSEGASTLPLGGTRRRAGPAPGADGVVFCELASLADPALLPASLAAALGMRDEATPEPQFLIELLTGWLTTHPVLLVLDNCEHLIEAVAALAHTLLEACPALKILATSRQRLGLTGEIAWRVPSLPVPDASHETPDASKDNCSLPLASGVSRLTSVPSVQLFVERAAAVRPGFQLTRREDAAAVAQICRRLEGIPLALELAAARVTVLSLPQIAAGLDDRFRLLTGGSRAALPRQRTLQALIDWSYELLPVEERALLRRLSVFAGGWTLEAAGAVCGDFGPQMNTDEHGLPAHTGEGSGIDAAHHASLGGARTDEPDPSPHPCPSVFICGLNIQNPVILDRLGGLEEKSLVVGVEREGVFRYGMLETVREYGRQKLVEAGEEEAARRQHLAFFLQLAEEARSALSGPGQKAALAVLEAELDNLRAALAWSQTAAPAMHGQLAAALWPFWFSSGRLTEGRQQLRVALSHVHPASGDPALSAATRADALLGASRLAVAQHDLAEARTLGQECLALVRALGDQRGIAGALSCLGWVSLRLAETAVARSQLEEALEICRRFGYRAEMRAAVTHLATLACMKDELALARARSEESLAVAQELGDEEAIAEALRTLGELALKEGDPARARSLLEQSLEIERRLGHRPATAAALEALGKLARQQHEYAPSLRYFEEALGIWREMGNPSYVAWNLLESGNAAYADGAYALARQSYEQSREGFRKVNDWWGLRCASNNLGSALFRLGEVAQARSLHRESLQAYQSHSSVEGIAWTLGRLGVIEAEHGEARRAARLLGAAFAAWEKSGVAAEHRQEQVEIDQAKQLLRPVLGDPGLEGVWAEGRAMSLDEAVEYALSGP